MWRTAWLLDRNTACQTQSNNRGATLWARAHKTVGRLQSSLYRRQWEGPSPRLGYSSLYFILQHLHNIELNWIYSHSTKSKTGITTGYGTSQAELNINLNFIRFDKIWRLILPSPVLSINHTECYNYTFNNNPFILLFYNSANKHTEPVLGCGMAHGSFVLWILLTVWYDHGKLSCVLYQHIMNTHRKLMENLPFYKVPQKTDLQCAHVHLTDSLWRRQSQQSFNTLTPFNFLFYSLHVSAPMGHPQVRYTISYYFCFWRTILIRRIRCTYAIWLSLFICHVIVLPADNSSSTSQSLSRRWHHCRG
jgi:hypothetical protein